MRTLHPIALTAGLALVFAGCADDTIPAEPEPAEQTAPIEPEPEAEEPEEVTRADEPEAEPPALAAEIGAPTADPATPAMPDPADPGNPDDYDFHEDWSDGIDPDKWLVAGWREHNMQTGPERTYVEDGKLNMVFVNDSEDGWLGAALQTQKEDFGYGRWEAALKPSSVPGVLNSMYTIDWRDGEGTKQEIDIEFLTHTFDGEEHPGEMWIALHAADRESTHFSQPLTFNPSEEFNVFGWDITPTHIDYLVNGETIYRFVYEEHDITFDAPYMLKFNVWTSESPWIQGPPEPDVETVYQVDWIRFKARDEQ